VDGVADIAGRRVGGDYDQRDAKAQSVGLAGNWGEKGLSPCGEMRILNPTLSAILSST
jgi:hypothetical protein